MKPNKNLILVIVLIAIVLVGFFFFLPAKKKADEKSPTTGDASKQAKIDSPWARPLRDIKFERTAQRLKQGKYLTEGILFCFTCHSPRNWNLPGAPWIDSLKGSGGTIVNQDSTHLVIAPNLTPDKETGSGTWTDDMFARAIREGVGHDGRVLNWQMPFFFFKNLSDEDLASVVVYIRSLPPVHHVVPPTKMPKEERAEEEKWLKPPTKPFLTADISTPEKRGQYLVSLAECVGCHTSHSLNNPGLFGGGNFVQRHLRRPAFSANITTDPSGIGYGPKAFAQVLHTGKGGTLSPAMPWVAFRNMNDDDLNAIYAFLNTFPRSHHYVNSQKPYTHCAVCGMDHGLGSMNKREIPAGIKLDPKLYDSYTGTYFCEEYNNKYIITRQGTKLIGRQDEKGSPNVDLIPQSAVHFIAPGWVLPVTFLKDKNGHVTGLKEDSYYGGNYKKLNDTVKKAPKTLAKS